MNILRNDLKVFEEKWARYKYNLTTPLGKDGRRVTESKEHLELSRRAAGEGAVLLENNGFLPLKKGTCVSLFGIASLDYIKGGGGSGQVFCSYIPNVYEAFKQKEPFISVYEPVSEFYYNYAVPNLKDLGDTLFKCELLGEPELNKELIKTASKESDAAIIVISRFSSENWDRSSEKGDFYLTDDESRLVEEVTKQFEHTVVVMDVGGIIDSAWIKENKKIDAALLAWQGGTLGAVAIADIICGDVNPSGKLVDTIAKTFEDYPSSDTFNAHEDYVDYYEDIYVGYRYFETISGAAEKVVYPFGYGLSYTTFELSKPVAKSDGEKITVTVNVKNTGDYAGKEVVQVYYSAPNGVLGKSAVELAAFAKTKLLKPCEEETLVLEYAIADMASFDDLGKLQKSAFVLEKGNYKIFAGTDCRTLKKADFEFEVTEEFKVVKQLKQLCAPEKLEKRMLSDGSFEELPKVALKQYEVKPYENTAKAPEGEEPVKFSEVAAGNITLDEFLKQYTDDELIALLGGVPNRGLANTCGMGTPDRLGVPAIMTADGPAGLRINRSVGIPTTAWPCATLMACTWNTDLMFEVGRAGGLEAKENALGIWLTPGMNIHRNPLCGRNFEYFSEDPLIAGKFAAAQVNGMQSVGTAASAKHFACNNKEGNRLNLDSRVSERALREIYLRGFEICVKEAQPYTIMTGYNIMNGVRPCESYELLEGILRGEWGFKGMVTTDWWGPLDHAKCVLAGNDIRMGSGQPDRLKEALEKGEIQRGHMETCAKRILEMILKLN